MLISFPPPIPSHRDKGKQRHVQEAGAGRIKINVLIMCVEPSFNPKTPVPALSASPHTYDKLAVPATT
jgi:hypothetical protein